MIFLPRISIMYSCLNFFEDYRNNSKKDYEENQSYLAEDTQQETISAANYQRIQVLNTCVTWDGRIVGFEVFRNNVEVHYGKLLCQNFRLHA
jgi:hypothetical protein